eukprot:TRINITY_DN7623_c1_g2_i1.p1 TRINITY_DN7623_c1_g2~~TRINITY_DN7623_c1_g2_i1.p1  ORF type:complete len:345 (-),score=46.92 TRINITY_DN7623_c1_g2_i1:225-1259(-)
MFIICTKRILLLFALFSLSVQQEINTVGRQLLGSSKSVSRSSASAKSGRSAEKIAAEAVCGAFYRVRKGRDVYYESMEVAKAFGKATAEALAQATTFTKAEGDAEANASATAKGVAVAEIISKAFASCIIKVCGNDIKATAQAEAVVKDVQTAVAEAESKAESVKGSSVESMVDAVSKAVASVSGKSVAKVLVVIKKCKATVVVNADAKAKKIKPQEKKKQPRYLPEPKYTPKPYHPEEYYYPQPSYRTPKLDYQPEPYYPPKYDTKPDYSSDQMYEPYSQYPPKQQYVEEYCPAKKCRKLGERMCCNSKLICRMMGYEYIKGDQYSCPHVKTYSGDMCYCEYF